jgi:hypothetical protein
LIMKQIASTLILCSILTLPIGAASAVAASAQDQTTTVKTKAQTVNAQPDPMATLKNVGDNLDTSMKAASKQVHKTIDDGAKNTARTTKQAQQSQAGKSMEKAGNQFGEEVKGFGNNLNKKFGSSLPKTTTTGTVTSTNTATGPGSKIETRTQSKTDSKKPLTGSDIQKNASKTLQNAGKAIDDSVKKLQNKPSGK